MIVGIANGANSSLIQTISVEVLPNPEAAAKDLGFLNLANTLGGVGGSFAAAMVITTVGYGGVFVGEAVVVLVAAALFRSNPPACASRKAEDRHRWMVLVADGRDAARTMVWHASWPVRWTTGHGVAVLAGSRWDRVSK